MNQIENFGSYKNVSRFYSPKTIAAALQRPEFSRRESEILDTLIMEQR
jgi:hypothetical protein